MVLMMLTTKFSFTRILLVSFGALLLSHFGRTLESTTLVSLRDFVEFVVRIKVIVRHFQSLDIGKVITDVPVPVGLPIRLRGRLLSLFNGERSMTLDE